MQWQIYGKTMTIVLARLSEKNIKNFYTKNELVYNMYFHKYFSNFLYLCMLTIVLVHLSYDWFIWYGIIFVIRKNHD